MTCFILLVLVLINDPPNFYTTRITEMLGRFYFNTIKTKIISNHMSQYFIHNRT